MAEADVLDPEFDLEETVSSVTAPKSKTISMLEKATGMYDRAADMMGNDQEERKAAAGRASKRIDVIDSHLDRIKDLKLDAEKPKFDVPEFKAPDAQYNPIEQFGSLASVIGIMASAMTRKPLTSALNASASAMEMAKNNDKVSYERAFKEWHANTNVALEHINFEKDMYKSAIDLMNTDFNRGIAQAQAQLASIGAEASLQLLRADPQKWIQMANSYVTAADKIDETTNQIVDEERVQTAVREAQAKAQAEGRAITQPEINDIIEDERRKLKATRLYAGSGSGVPQRLLEIQDEFDQAMKAADSIKDPVEKAAAQRAAADRRDQRRSALRGAPAKGVDAVLEDWVNEQRTKGKEPTADEIIAKRQEIMKGGLTGTDVRKIQDQIGQLDNSLDAVDESLGVLDKYVGAAGASGYARRIGERVGNIFGSNETDKTQFMRTIKRLQVNAPRLLTDSDGRPLSAEASKIEDIIAGLNILDTTANTKRALEEIQELYIKMRRDKDLQRRGEWKPREERDDAPAAARPRNDAWRGAPLIPSR